MNGDMKVTAPNYLTLDKCATKFNISAKAVGNPEDTLKIIAVDSTILSYKPERLAESFLAWSVKLGSKEKAVELAARNPPILSIGPLFIESADQGAVIQTYFWSYVAVAFRPLTLGLQKLIRPLVRG